MTTPLEDMQKALAKDNWWRLFIDGKKQMTSDRESKFGWLDWSLREPHGLLKIKKTAEWLFTEEHINDELTLDFLFKLNSSVVPASDSLVAIVASMDQRIFNFHHGNIDYLEQVAENMRKSAGLERPPFILKDGNIIAQWTYQECKHAFAPIVKQYYEDLSKSENKMKVILSMAQKLENMHIFLDGNCRTIVTLWTNKELIANGYQPAIFYDPNDFDYFTINELVNSTQEGQIAFTKYLHEGIPYDNCVKDEVIQANIQAIEVIDPILPKHHFEGGEITNLCANKYISAAISNRLNAISKFFEGKDIVVFEEFEEFWNKKFCVEIIHKICRNVTQEITREVIERENFSGPYIKAFCASKKFNLDGPIEAKELHKIVSQFLTSIATKLKTYETKYGSAFKHLEFLGTDRENGELLIREFVSDERKISTDKLNQLTEHFLENAHKESYIYQRVEEVLGHSQELLEEVQ